MHTNIHLPRARARLDRSAHVSPRLSTLLRGITVLAACWLFTAKPIFFSVDPLSLALVASLEHSVGWGLLGIALGLWQTGESVILRAAATVTVLLVRLAVHLLSQRADEPHAANELARLGSALRAHLLRLLYLGRPTDAPTEPLPLPITWDEPLRLRVLAALVGGLIPALGIPIAHGFPFYDLCGAVLYLVLLPPATVLLHYALAADEVPRTLAHVLGLAALLAAVCFCGRTVTWLGISPVVCLVLVLTLEATSRYGLGAGMVPSIIGGLCYAPLTVPIYLAVALSHALFSHLLSAAAMLLSAGVAYLAALLLGGATTLQALAPSLTVGILVDAVLHSLLRYGAHAQSSRSVKPHEQDESISRRMAEEGATAAARARRSTISSAFSTLAETARSRSALLSLPDADELRAVLDGVMDEHCPRCPHRARCWSEEYSATAEGIRAVSRWLSQHPDDVEGATAAFSADLRTRCPVLPELLGETRYRAARLASTHQRAIHTELLADAYDAIAHLLRDTLHESGAEHDARTVREDVAASVLAALNGRDIHPRHVLVTGERALTVRICGISPAALTLSREELSALLSEACGVKLSRPRYDGADDGTLTLHEEVHYRASCRYISRAAPSSETDRARPICGDTLRTFVTEGGLFYALLCDGMGSGRQAAQTSGAAAGLLERSLGAGVSIGTALRLVDHFLRSCGDRPERECSSTVDLLEIDLYTGQGRLVKSGAAPSIVLHGSRIYRLAAHTVPLGILGTVDAQTTPLELSTGDRILLLSDGVTDIASSESGTDDTLGEYLSGDLPEADGELAEALLTLCRAHGSLDDATVAVIRIEAAG